MSKETVLTLLRSQPGEYLSGEAVSETLGLSRAAIWKAVDALRRSGYVIEARTGLGYRLLEAPDVLTEPEIRNFLPETERVGRELYCLAEVDSTNTYAKGLAIQGAPDGMVVVADCQTGGRGRQGRSFSSPEGKGVYLTALMRPALPPERLLPVTALAAVAVCNAIEQTCGIRPQIKWTNDLVLNGKKLCGILTEMALEGESGCLQYLVIGIGVNVLQTEADFSGKLADMAVSLRQATGKAISRPQLAAREIFELDRLYRALEAGETAEYLKAYRRDCVTLGKEVQLVGADGDREPVTALDVDDQFGLIVRRKSGETEIIRTGEVSVRGMYGYVD